jgi:predicted dehydrogenase
MKFLILGSGSIAIRHYNNLKKIGYKHISFYTKNVSFRERYKNSYGNLITAIKKTNPDIAIICNSTHLHMTSAIKCAQNGLHLFIEKPVSHKISDCKNLINIVKKKRLHNMIGYMLRFHPAIFVIKKILANKKITKPYFAYSEWGEYLPRWQPNRNYKTSYAANKKMGGGVSLTLSHDLDLLFFLFGKVKKIYNERNEKLFLNINCDTTSDYLIKFKNKLNALVHLDYLQKKNSRYLKIIGQDYKIIFEYLKNRLYFEYKNSFKKYYFKKFKRNDMFVAEIKYFLNCIKKNKKAGPSIKESVEMMKNFNLI